ncbi:MAG: helix-turn-helix transcriptional regulator [Methanobrevibacter sp.]|nr:helix-turn-helix transcriptional regulator [Methanobrevibacter sp.]MBP5785289.1 helix-turn-helix transcriptional regulator [Methanobrevibacter sp.]
MFWNNVKNLLDISNLTQKELSALTDINLGTLKNQICRNVIPDAIEAVKIAKALNTTVEFLVTGTEENQAEKELTELKAKLADLIMFKK